MSIIQISKIQVRTGNLIDLPQLVRVNLVGQMMNADCLLEMIPIV